jgi:hypothetical protein
MDYSMKPIRTVLTLLSLAAPLLAAIQPGVTLLPKTSGTSTLVDETGATLKTFNYGSYSAYLTDSATLIHTATATGLKCGAMNSGKIQEHDWNGTLKWEFTWASSTTMLHHSINIMPNGNVLGVGYEQISGVCQEVIFEYSPAQKAIVWEWHSKDHLSTDTYNPRKFKSSLITGSDPYHINSVAYDAQKDMILFSAHNLHEIYVIDHSTTTAQAASSTGGKYNKGGDILWRWGKAANYGVTATDTTWFNVVHGANVIPAGLPGSGNFLAYANKNPKTGLAAAYEIQPELADTGFVIDPVSKKFKATLIANISLPTGTTNWGNVQRLPNGNTLITHGNTGKVLEATSAGTFVDTITSASVARATRYPWNFPGLYKLSGYTGTVAVAAKPRSDKGVIASGGKVSIHGLADHATAVFVDMQGRIMARSTPVQGIATVSTASWPRGLYRVVMNNAGKIESHQVTVLP